MSIIGPRPLLVEYLPYYTEEEHHRHDVIESLNINLSKVNDFIKRIGYSGLFSVEFLRGQDGNNYFLEINMRNDGNHVVGVESLNLTRIIRFI